MEEIKTKQIFLKKVKKKPFKAMTVEIKHQSVTIASCYKVRDRHFVILKQKEQDIAK